MPPQEGSRSVAADGQAPMNRSAGKDRSALPDMQSAPRFPIICRVGRSHGQRVFGGDGKHLRQRRAVSDGLRCAGRFDGGLHDLCCRRKLWGAARCARWIAADEWCGASKTEAGAV